MQAQLQIAMYSNFSSCVVVIPHTYQTHYLVAQNLMWIFSRLILNIQLGREVLKYIGAIF